MTPCKYFAQGRCNFGASCKNSHEAAAGVDWRAASTPSTPQSCTKIPESNENLFKFRTTQVPGPCRHFSTGKCLYGSTCHYSHDTGSSDIALHPVRPREFRTQSGASLEIGPVGAFPPTFVPGALQHESSVASLPQLKADVPAFTPIIQAPFGQNQLVRSATIPACVFYSQGFCRKGVTCSFRHESPAFHPPGIEENKVSDLSNDASLLSISTSFSQDFHGADVMFVAGAEVSSVKLSSDFSTIQLSGLSPDAQISFVTDLLADLGFQVPQSAVYMKSLGEEGSVAEVKVEDASFARIVTRKFESQQDENAKRKIIIKAVAGHATTGALANRLQLSTVTCTWYKPSSIAWLMYKTNSQAVNAKNALGSRKILQRTPTYSIQPEGRRLAVTLLVGNLDIATEKRHICTALPSSLHPERINFGEPTYSFSDTEASELIKALLQTKGRLESFQPKVVPGNSKIKATAVFADHDEAAEAVQSLNNTSVEILGDTKLFVGHVISVKYNVPNTIIRAIERDIDQLRENIWQQGHVHLKSYPQKDPAKAMSAIRVFGEDVKIVSEAKAALEKMLAGTVVINGDSALWDSYFGTARSLTYLNEVSQENNIYIYRDARKSRLLMYGGLPATRLEIERILISKVESLQHPCHTVTLTPDLLQRAMQGGMRRLKERFRVAVTLNVSVNPRTISIVGSESDVQEARALLRDDSSPTQDLEDCVVCWTEATEALHTKCGHVYCKDCFANQASSVGDCDFPVQCYGNEGQCLNIFSIEELKTMLGHIAFEELLEASFEAHIRTHPQDFQNCPTPDCPQVYRTTSISRKFLCSICLTSVCTACKVVAHDGITCEEYKDLNSEDAKAFQKWKKENNARDCPNCKVSIQKSYGCNHMECRQCSTHICWFCMKNFTTTTECYAHMTKAHGNYFED